MNPFDRKVNEEKTNIYPNIERGASFVIPVFLMDEAGKSIISNDIKLYFTLKKEKFDFDYEDDRALIKKDAILVNEFTGRYDIKLTSKDTWLPPSEYYFDIMMKHNDDFYRIYTAKTNITAAPSNRFQRDEISGDLLGEVICIGAYTPCPINVTLQGQFVLDPSELPLTASPSFLLKKNEKLNTQEIQHFTSRMRFPVVLEQKKDDNEFFIFDDMTDFNFREGNPMGAIKIGLNKNCFSIWSIPRRAKIKFFGDEYKELNIGQSIEIPDKKDFIFHIHFENHLLIVSGRHIGNKWPLMVEWFDFNK